jgi:hypothetical protein
MSAQLATLMEMESPTTVGNSRIRFSNSPLLESASRSVAERLYEVTGSGEGSEYLAIAKEIGHIILALGDLRADLRHRALRKEMGL